MPTFANSFLISSVPCSPGIRSLCQPLQLENGRVRIKNKGRVAKFKCRRQFEKFDGDDFATCVRRQWNGRIPKCIRECLCCLLSACWNVCPVRILHALFIYSESLFLPFLSLASSISCKLSSFHSVVSNLFFSQYISSLLTSILSSFFTFLSFLFLVFNSFLHSFVLKLLLLLLIILLPLPLSPLCPPFPLSSPLTSSLSFHFLLLLLLPRLRGSGEYWYSRYSKGKGSSPHTPAFILQLLPNLSFSPL